MISPLAPITVSILLSLAAGVVASAPNASTLSHKLSASLQVVAGIAGLAGAAMGFFLPAGERWLFDWGLPFGAAEVGIDPLSAFFLLPIFIITACSALYFLHYWPVEENSAMARRLTFFSAILTVSLTTIVIARHAIVFLMAWEVMALACYFAMTVDDRKKEVREAGLLYLVTAHFGTLALFALFALLKGASGSFALPETASVSAAIPAATIIFLTALFGFGMKAGIMPLHIWLPSAHANAPSHISAVMSGVLIKMGIYGLIRTCSLFTGIPFWWGGTILIAGIISGIVGVVFAIGQHDIKRLLAYHSIENIGIICIGLGLALLGVSHGMPVLILLGLSGALLHTLNHALFKSLLFLGAGSVIHACGTREIDRMGGLIKKMPYTAAFFLIGAVAICGLPPLNGFVSEWLIYLGLFRGILDADTLNDPFCALAVASLALIGGLALACFVKLFGVAFLGSPRNEHHVAHHEAGGFMLAPMALLATLCAVIGILPIAVAPLLERVSFSLYPAIRLAGVKMSDHASLGTLSVTAILLLVAIGISGYIYLRRLKALPRSTADTWGCGYLAPTPRMQYTSSSFAAVIVSLFSGILRPHGKKPVVSGLFPKGTSFRSHIPETLLEGVYLPLFDSANSRLSAFRKLQHGKLHLYILYIVVTLVALLTWSHFRGRG